MKKILSMFLVLCLVLIILPVSAMAEETHTTIDNFTDLQDAIKNTTGDLDLKLSDSYITSNGTLTIDNNHNITIDLNGKTLDGGSNNAIKHNGTGTLTIKDTGTNGKVTSAADKAINSISYGTIDLRGGILAVESGTIENTLNSGDANAILKNHGENGAVILTGGTIIAAQGTAIYYGYLPSMPTSPSGIIIPNGTPVIKGDKAMNEAPDLSSYTNVKVTASINYDGSDPVYNPDNYYNYKYLKFGQGSDTTVSNFNLTSKLTAPATGGTPATTLTDDQYTGTIAWSDNPTMFLGDTVYTATVTLTAKDGYTFSGVAENAFSYDGATSVINSIGSDKTMTVTIVFPQTMARTLQQITITTPPTKTTYYCGENFEKAGMIVKASYDDGTTDENFTDYTVDKTESLTPSDNLITLTAEGTSIKTTQAITVTKKTPAIADLDYDLTAVDYDSTEKPVSVMAAPDKSLGTITVKYNGSTTVPTNAGNYLITVDIAESTEYNATTDLSLGNYTINKIDYSGTTTLSENILVDGKIGASITLPDIPEGSNYGTPVVGGTVMMTDMSISGNTLTYTAPASTSGQIGIMTIPVTGATNYKDYNIVATITYTAKTPQMISYETTTITKTYGDTKFVNPLTQDDINGTITYASDDTAVATVNPSTGEVTIVSVGDGSATITATAMETDTHAQATASYVVTVSKKALTLKADDKNMIQGDELPNFTFTVIGLVNGDTVTAPPTISTTTNGATVGIFDITPSGGVVENTSSYDINYTKGILTVAETQTYTVTFNSNTGSAVAPITATKNGTITVPIPTKRGYTFGGWYKEAGLINKFTNATPVTENINLYAKWIQNVYTETYYYYTVSFNSNGGSAINAITVIENGTINSLKAPTKEGYIFDGWYTDNGIFAKEFTKISRVTRNITLYAKWIDKAVEDVDNMIIALPAVEKLKLTDEPAVLAARKAYTALTAEQQALLTKLNDLESIETKLAEIQASFKVWNEQTVATNVPANKEWRIKFNKNVDLATAKENIYIIDNETKQLFSTEVFLSEDGKVIILKLEKDKFFTSGKTYTLYINSDVKNIDYSVALKTGIKMEFTIK